MTAARSPHLGLVGAPTARWARHDLCMSGRFHRSDRREYSHPRDFAQPRPARRREPSRRVASCVVQLRSARVPAGSRFHSRARKTHGHRERALFTSSRARVRDRRERACAAFARERSREHATRELSRLVCAPMRSIPSTPVRAAPDRRTTSSAPLPRVDEPGPARCWTCMSGRGCGEDRPRTGRPVPLACDVPATASPCTTWTTERFALSALRGTRGHKP